ncbi:MAG: hypothetical protein ABI314_02360, partial [Gemmatimonadaceae bacterium]
MSADRHPRHPVIAGRTIPDPLTRSVARSVLRRVCLAAVLILPAAARAQLPADSIRTVTLSEALALSARVNPALAAGAAAVSSARAGRLLVTGEYL